MKLFVFQPSTLTLTLSIEEESSCIARLAAMGTVLLRCCMVAGLALATPRRSVSHRRGEKHERQEGAASGSMLKDY